jgi:L1 cell adhesion molecule like protein
MADFALGSVEKIVKAAMAIKKAVQTVRQNEVECREIEELAATIMDILLLLQNTAVMNQPAMNRALDGLERTLNYALKLVTVCQGRNVACRLLGSGDISRKLRQVKDDILHKTVLGTFATTVRVTMTLTNTIRYGGAHHLLTQTQVLSLIPYSFAPWSIYRRYIYMALANHACPVRNYYVELWILCM